MSRAEASIQAEDEEVKVITLVNIQEHIEIISYLGRYVAQIVKNMPASQSTSHPVSQNESHQISKQP